MEHVLAGEDVQAPIPLLTSWHRDSWAAARNHLLSLDPNHRENTTTIESSLFAVALDDNANGADPASWTRTAFCGHQGLGNGHNRWYDKSFTAIVESNGKCAISGEHSPADALIVSYIFDYMLKEPCPGPFNIAAVRPTPGQYASFARYFDHLKWTVDDTMHRYLRFAQADADATAALSDSFVYIFRDFGTDWIKKVGKVSPDAFYQMVLQLAYYRLHKKVTATYETGSTRKYLHGRTDTIRTCSVDTKALVEAWHDPKTDVSRCCTCTSIFSRAVLTSYLLIIYISLKPNTRFCPRLPTRTANIRRLLAKVLPATGICSSFDYSTATTGC